MVSDAGPEKPRPLATPAGLDGYLPTPENESDPETYRILARQVKKMAYCKELGFKDAEGLLKIIRADCEESTGMTLGDVMAEKMDAIQLYSRLNDMTEATEDLLNQMESAFEKIDSIDAALKKKMVSLRDRVLKLQAAAREDPAKCMIYIDRNCDPDQAGELMDPKWWNVANFRTWTDPHYQHSLVMMPPNHGKTTALGILVVFEIGHQPELRCLLVFDISTRAGDMMGRIKTLLKRRAYHALFPDVRILGRKDDKQERSTRLTVARRNTTAKDATIEAVGIGENVNGARYDRIYGDDFSTPEVAEQAYARQKVIRIWDQVIEQRAAPRTSRFRVICTPWHPEDKAGQIRRLVEEGHLRTWKVDVERYAILDDPVTHEAIPIWPDKFTPDYYRVEKIKLGSRYACIHQLKARAEYRKTLNKLWYWNTTNENRNENDAQVQEKMRTGEWWLSIDPAGSGQSYSSRHGAIRAVLMENKFCLLTDVWFHQKSAPDMFDWLVEEIAARWKAGTAYTGIIIESQGPIAGMVSTWEAWLKDRLPKTGIDPDYFPVFLAPGTNVGVLEGTRNRNKMDRHIAASPWLQHGIVRLAGRRPGPHADGNQSACEAIPNSDMARLGAYLLSFDGTNFSDAVDAVNQLILVFNEYGRLADISVLSEQRMSAARHANAARNASPSPLCAAAGDFMRKISNPEEPDDDPVSAIEAMWSKYGIRRSSAA